jgi:hypothetical protein
LEEECGRDRITSIEEFDSDKKQITIRKDFERKFFSFDSLLAPSSNQEDVYKITAQSVIEVIIINSNK